MKANAIDVRGIPIFDALPRAGRAAIRSAARLRDYHHGEQVFRPGDVCADVIIVLDGHVRLFRSGPDGTDVTIALVTHEDMLSVAALRGAAVHEAGAEAVGLVRVIEIPGDVFLATMRHFPDLFSWTVWKLAGQTDAIYMHTTVDTGGQLWSQVLHALRELTPSTRTGSDDTGMCSFTFRLSHAEIARYVGADRSSVTRALGYLHEQGLIQREHGHVISVWL